MERTVQPHSVRTIVRVLCRRLRANATLRALLVSLQRQQIPRWPQEDGLPPNTVTEHACKLAQFASLLPSTTTDSADDVLSYKVLLRKKDAEPLLVQVAVHKARYPEVPPEWTLNVTPDGTPVLYNDKLAELERCVNVEMLENMKEASEVAQEWILIHQLHRIMEEWDSW